MPEHREITIKDEFEMKLKKCNENLEKNEDSEKILENKTKYVPQYSINNLDQLINCICLNEIAESFES